MLQKKELFIEGIKKLALGTPLPSIKLTVINELFRYGEEAIPAIQEIMESTKNPEVKESGLQLIKIIKEKPRDWRSALLETYFFPSKPSNAES